MDDSKHCKKSFWAGCAISALVVLPFAFSVFMIFTGSPQLAEGLAHLGLPDSLIKPIAVIELLCIVTYVIPPSSILGAILFTGYIGGTIITHLRVHEAVPLQITLGILIWLGLYLRDPRLRQILPLRKCQKHENKNIQGAA